MILIGPRDEVLTAEWDFMLDSDRNCFGDYTRHQLIAVRHRSGQLSTHRYALKKDGTKEKVESQIVTLPEFRLFCERMIQRVMPLEQREIKLVEAPRVPIVMEERP